MPELTWRQWILGILVAFLLLSGSCGIGCTIISKWWSSGETTKTKKEKEAEAAAEAAARKVYFQERAEEERKRKADAEALEKRQEAMEDRLLKKIIGPIEKAQAEAKAQGDRAKAEREALEKDRDRIKKLEEDVKKLIEVQKAAPPPAPKEEVKLPPAVSPSAVSWVQPAPGEAKLETALWREFYERVANDRAMGCRVTPQIAKIWEANFARMTTQEKRQHLVATHWNYRWRAPPP